MDVLNVKKTSLFQRRRSELLSQWIVVPSV